MVQVFVSVGSNIERDRHIRAALDALESRYGRLLISQIYESEAVGFEGDLFYNLVVGFDTDEKPADLDRELHAIEAANGRNRDAPKFSARTLDLDLLLYGDAVVESGRLKLPRDEITRYAFVLQPLAELAGEARHPLTGETYQALWARFDASRQRLWPVPFER